MIEVKINGVVKWQVNEYTFVDPQMGLRSISLTVTHPSDNVTVPSFVGAYVEYEGERYDIVNSKPTAEKGIDSINYKYNLIFNGQAAELQKRKIRNLATVGIDTFISQGTAFSLYADINQFKQLLENNLKYYFGSKWTINLGSTTSESVMVSVNNMFIWDLLLKTFEYYGLRWNITGNTINIGYTPDSIQHVFDYGYSGGLVKITRTAQSEPTINRLIGVGGSRNVPINYFTNRYSDFPVDPNPISGDVNIKNTMPKVFRDSVIAGTLPYIDYVEDAALVAAEGVKEDALDPNEEIYPSIAGVEVTGLGRIDQIIAVSNPTANTPDDAEYSPTFDIWVKDIGFDLSDSQYTATQDAKISFTSGMLAGYEFVILATNGVRNVVVDTSKSYGGVSSKYKITLINSSEDFTATGRMLPNSAIKAMAGDSFVIYDIIMPQTYVELAELRVQNWLNEQLLVKKVEKPTYAIETTDTFFEENIAPESDGKTIREKLKSGNKLTVNNTKVTDGAQELHINNITIQYGGLLPKYSFMVTDKVSVQGSVTQRIQSSVRTVELRQSEISNKVGDVYSSSHSHHNKGIIDQILQQHLDVLGVLSIVDGNLEIDANAYSTKELSAYGVGEGGGGGGFDYERLDTWASYDSSKAEWVLSAFLGNDLNTRVTDLENSAGSGSVTSVGISVPTGLSVSNSPITSSGVIAIGLQAGYSIPTTAKQGQWDTAYTNNHTHANKTVLDGITSALVSNWNTAFTNNHTHSNKTQLDLITQSNIDVLAKLSIVNGNLQIDGNAYATGELSAYGAGNGGGGGGGIIETVYGYGNLGQTFNNSILTDTFNAYTINQINTRLLAVESGSATTVNTTGTGNAITSISKSGTVITANKDFTFSLSGHTHAISDITNLQTALNNKLETSIFNTHNNDNIRHITEAERTKWDGVVTDFGNLEIGGRNLIIQSLLTDNFIDAGGALSPSTLVSATEFIEVIPETNYIHTNPLPIPNNMYIGFYDENKLFIRRVTVPISERQEYHFKPNANEYFVRISSSALRRRENSQLEKGTIPTDWSPAFEDQVSDWNTTDVDSFSFIKNKPTLLSQFTDNIGVATHIANKANPHSVTKAQVGLGNVDNTADSEKNVLSASKLSTSRTIWGQSFDGTGNVAGALSGATTGSFTGAVTVNTLNISSTALVPHIAFSRPLPNYITAPLGGGISFVTNGDSISALNSIMILSSNGNVGIGKGFTSAITSVTAQLHVIGNILATGTTTTTKVIFNAAGWSMEQVGSELQMKHNNVLKMRFTSTGSIVATEEITAFG